MRIRVRGLGLVLEAEVPLSLRLGPKLSIEPREPTIDTEPELLYG